MKVIGDTKEINGIKVVQDPIEIEKALKNGEKVYHWERGNSMAPLINDSEYCLITPCKPIDVKRGDAVFCVIKDEKGYECPMVHQVWEISDSSHTNELWFKIGSTSVNIFGWTNRVYGKAKGTDIYHEDASDNNEFVYW